MLPERSRLYDFSEPLLMPQMLSVHAYYPVFYPVCHLLPVPQTCTCTHKHSPHTSVPGMRSMKSFLAPVCTFLSFLPSHFFTLESTSFHTVPGTFTTLPDNFPSSSPQTI